MLCISQLTYSNHAFARMVDRGVFKKQVRRTLRRPEKVFVRGQDQVAEYTTSAKAIVRVVYRHLPDADAFLVISVIRLGELKGVSQRAALGTHYDRSLDLAYIALLSGAFSETIEVAEGIYYDLDRHGEIVGAEIFNYSRYEEAGGQLPSLFRYRRIPPG